MENRKNNEFEIEGKCVVRLSGTDGAKKATHLGSEFNLRVSEELDREKYFDPDGLPNAAGSKLLTVAFVQGVLGNIHFAHQSGFRDSAEHLRYVIEELEKGFVEVASARKSEFTM